MQYRRLGSSGIDVSSVGFGAWAVGGWMWGGVEEGQAVAAIQAALDHEVNLIDTAPIYGYGRSEELVGRAIRGRRGRVVVATKCGLVWDRDEGEFFFHADDHGGTPGPSKYRIHRNLRPASIRAEVEQSLRRLQTDYIDLLQTHWQDATTPLEETVAELMRLKEAGKIRAIGVSNANLQQLQSYGPVDSAQEKFSMLDRQIEHNGVQAHCRAQGISLLPYSPLANGLLTGTIAPGRRYGTGDLRATHPRFVPDNVRRVNAALADLEPLARRHKASIAQLVVAWTAAQPAVSCVLCGARDARQAMENAAAGTLALSAADLRDIDAVASRLAAAA